MTEKPKTVVEQSAVVDEKEVVRKALSRQNDMMRSLQGPGHVDQTFRMCLQQCWAALPEDRKTIDELERQMLRLVKRAIEDMREDNVAFGYD